MDYFVIKANGERWGPVSLENLNLAIAAKTAVVPGDTMLEEAKTGSQLRASLVSGLDSAPAKLDDTPRLHQEGLRNDKWVSLLFGVLIIGHLWFLVARHLAGVRLAYSVPIVLGSNIMLGPGLIGAMLMAQGKRGGIWTCAITSLGLVITALHQASNLHQIDPSFTGDHAFFAIPYAVMAAYAILRIAGYPKVTMTEQGSLRLPENSSSLGVASKTPTPEKH